MKIYNELVNKKSNIVIVGLGYVGLPLAAAFARKGINIIGYDVNKTKIVQYKNGVDPTKEIGGELLKKVKIDFTSSPDDIRKGNFIIVAVPTPIDKFKKPDLSIIKNVTKTIGANLTKGSIIVYESTVYPGVTEEICIPILEKTSKMKCGMDFKVGYSPERINPGDKNNTIDKVVKIVSGIDQETTDIIAKVYEIVVNAGVYKAPSIKVAEAAKVIENIQRDVNIALVNEFALIFGKMGIDTSEVIEAAGTKWNFIKFNPGLVGGHCIGIDPYYLIHKAKTMGVKVKLISSAREINDSMSRVVVDITTNKLKKHNIKLPQARVLVLGITFKENIPDIRNSKIPDIIKGLEKKGIIVEASDPHADTAEALKEYKIKLISNESKKKYDAIIIAVSHDEYRQSDYTAYKKLLKADNPILIDVKGVLDEKVAAKYFDYWKM
ncbi:MAG: nucleotide sugar dehydrogenase [Bacilli bacterium]|nr:nucleotide sugar dehydrogenase [Bacilli bacterium]